MGLIPDFQLAAGDEDRTAQLRARLLSIKLTTETEHKADELVLEFDDAGNALALPAHGAVLTLSLGYAGEALFSQGRFTVDTSDPSMGPEGDRIEVKAKGADVRASLKGHKGRSFHGAKLGAVLGQVATDNGLIAVVHPDLADVDLGHLDQTGESDLHLVTRLGRRFDAVAQFKGGKLIFAPKGLAVSASGKTLPVIELARTDLKACKATDADRPKAGRVRAGHYDHAKGGVSYETAGDGEPTVTLRHVHRDAAHARAHAHAHHRHRKRKGHGIEFEPFEGRPDISAGRAVVLTGLRDGLAGRWVCEKVEHDWDFAKGGATTKVEATVDGRSADTVGDAAPGYGGDDADPDNQDDTGDGA